MITDFKIIDAVNGNRYYYCRLGVLKAEYSTDGITENHMSLNEFKDMVFKAQKNSIWK